ncbi:hypothetical protein PSHT_02239, partial [Puccinia striiformis]
MVKNREANSPLATLFHFVGLGFLLDAFRRIPYGIFSPKWEAGLAFLLCGVEESSIKMNHVWKHTLKFLLLSLAVTIKKQFQNDRINALPLMQTVFYDSNLHIKCNSGWYKVSLGTCIRSNRPFLSAVQLMMPGFYSSFEEFQEAITRNRITAITSIYWPIIILNPKLMMPPDASMIMPLGMDLALHLYPALLLWIDYFAFSDRLKNPSNGKIRLTESIQLSTFQLTVLVTVAYVSRVELSPKLDGFFLISNKNFSTKDPYPFLNDVNFPIRLAIYTGASGLCYMYASIAEGLHGFFIKS